MSEFRPLREQDAEPLPEAPFLNLQLEEGINIPQIRHAVMDFVRTNETLKSCVGCPVSEWPIDDIELSLAELLSNAQRPEAGRHATGVYVWAERQRISIGVGDDSDTIAGEDERPQTTVLSADLGAVALDSYDEAFSFELTSGNSLASSGLGGSLVAMLASHVSYSRVSAEEAARQNEPRTHKIVRADFEVPLNPAFDEAA